MAIDDQVGQGRNAWRWGEAAGWSWMVYFMENPMKFRIWGYNRYNSSRYAGILGDNGIHKISYVTNKMIFRNRGTASKLASKLAGDCNDCELKSHSICSPARSNSHHLPMFGKLVSITLSRGKPLNFAAHAELGFPSGVWHYVCDHSDHQLHSLAGAATGWRSGFCSHQEIVLVMGCLDGHPLKIWYN